MNSLQDDKDALTRQYVLDKIASGESPGYNVLYGGSTFDSLADHPRVRVPLPDGSFSSAAGRYQFLSGTWDEEAKRLGLRDFSPASQDQAAWDLASRTYKSKTGRELAADAAARNVDWNSLSSKWTSLKGASLKETSGGASGNLEAQTGEEGEEKEEDAMLPSPPLNPMAAQLLQTMSKGFKFTPVEYDPFAVGEKSKVGALS